MRASGCASVSKRKREGERDDFSQTDLLISHLRAWVGFFGRERLGGGIVKTKKKQNKKRRREPERQKRGGAPPPPPTIVAFSRGAQMLVTRHRKRWLIEIGDDEGHILCGGQQDCCWQNCFPLSFISSSVFISLLFTAPDPHRPRFSKLRRSKVNLSICIWVLVKHWCILWAHTRVARCTIVFVW